MGSYRNFEALGKDMIAKYGKPIMILETAHSFTTGTVNGKWMGDWCDNSYNYPDWNDATNAQNYTPQKQREWLLALAKDVKAGGGIGVITWGTESLPDLLEGKAQGHGLGLYTYPAAWGYGSTWENNSYWDFTDGNNLHDGINWMMDLL
jgi:arabinogalactan endo-1,4-beta-galactosidase